MFKKKQTRTHTKVERKRNMKILSIRRHKTHIEKQEKIISYKQECEHISYLYDILDGKDKTKENFSLYKK